MKKSVLLTLACFTLLGLPPTTRAAPKNEDADHRRAQIAEMAKSKETRLMMIHQLMSTAEGKKELAEALKRDKAFRSYYESNSVNPG